ncbi:MAG: hypothetical protein NVS1B3_15560 [Candidatus Dormibacteraceae bacterium]
MRYSKVIVASGTVRTNALGLRPAVVIAVVVVGVAWAAVAFAQEAYVGHKLIQQVADVRKQNAILASQNQGYRKDVLGITSGSAAEEEARLSGYARPSERLYLVTAVPASSPTPPVSPSPSTK